jgi:hypothetical protein
MRPKEAILKDFCYESKVATAKDLSLVTEVLIDIRTNLDYLVQEIKKHNAREDKRRP